jgi:hypothetical protein
MKKIKLDTIINISIIIWLVFWLYYMVFNWDVFVIKLNTSLGFTLVGGYPFIFFSVVGLVVLLVLKYFNKTIQLEVWKKEAESNRKLALLEKDIEILKLRETIYKMQSEELSKNSATLEALHKKLDNLDDSTSSNDEKTQTSPPEDNHPDR